MLNVQEQQAVQSFIENANPDDYDELYFQAKANLKQLSRKLRSEAKSVLSQKDEQRFMLNVEILSRLDATTRHIRLLSSEQECAR